MTIVGRKTERAQLARPVERARVVAVVGSAGSGRTALLDAAHADAADRGATVLATHGRRADRGMRFAPLLTLLRPVEADLDPRADGDQVRAALVRILTTLAARRPLVVLVDDAHLLDPATADVLACAVGRLRRDPVLTVVATEDDAPTAFDDLVADTITLHCLPDDEIAALITATIPLAPDPLHRCVALAAGNPRAALELAAALDPAQRRGDAPMPMIPRITGPVAHRFARRLAPLSALARGTLALLAADDSAALLGHLAADGLAEAEAAGIVAIADGVARFTHPLLRAVAYHQVDAATRRAVHAALADALTGPHQAVARVGHQIAAAERVDPSFAEALAQAAADIARRGDHVAAARTLESAAPLAAGLDHRRDLLVAAARAWLDAGDVRQAARIADSLAVLPTTGASVAVAAEAFRASARPTAGVLAFVTAARDAASSDAERAGHAAVLAHETAGAGMLDDAVATATPLVDAPGPAGHLAAAVLACAGVRSPSRSPLIGTELDPLGERAVALATDAAVDAGWPCPAAARLRVGGRLALDLAVSRAVAALHAGDVGAAHDQLRQLDAADRAADRAAGWRPRLDLALAEVEMLLGRPDAAAERAGAVAGRADELGLGWWRGRAAWILGRVALAAGDDPAAVDHLRAACRTVPHLAGADLAAAAVAAEVADAAALVDRAQRWVGDEAPILDVRARRALGALGDVAQLDAACARAESAGLPLEAAAVVLVGAELAWRRGDGATARAAADDAARRYAACEVTGWAARLARLQQPPLTAILSPAEHRVALAVAEGRTNQQAAATLFLSVKTVDFHLQNIYRKLDLQSRTQLAVTILRDS